MKEKIVFKIILIVSIIVSIGAAYYFISTQDNLLYRDAKSHLNIANRVFFSQTPGLAQLGGTWLPVPHIMMFPLIWNNDAYYSGLAGALPAMMSFVIFVSALCAGVYLYTRDKFATLITALVPLSNPSLLYLQTTPMSELPLLAFVTLSMLFFLRWIQRKEYVDIIHSAIFICLATLTRYDAWFVFIFQICLFILLAFFSKTIAKKIQSHLLLFIFMGGFGIFLWLIYNQLIFGHPLNFALGQGSGSWDANRVSSGTGLTTKYDLPFSFLTYFWMVIDNVGMVAFIASLVGFVLLMFSQVKAVIKIGACIFLAPFIFNVISLYLGQSVAFSKHIFPYETYNLRYGIAFLPFVAFFLGYLASKNNYAKAFVIIIIAFQAALFYTKPLEILVDANVGNISAETKVAHWIKDHPKDGKVLLSTLAHDPLLFEARIPMQNLVYEGNQHLWKNALKSPDFHVKRIVYKESDKTNDAVRRALSGKPILNDKYGKVYDDGDYKVYDRKNNR